MPTFGAWEAEVLEHTYDVVDYISMHDYYEPVDDDLDSFLASSVDMDTFIGAVVSTADHVGARLRQHAKADALVRRVERLVPDAVRRSAQPRLAVRAAS